MSIYVDIQKNFGSFRLDVRLEAENETLALLGPSGSGKSLTLRCIAGIERPDAGRIVIDGRTVFDSATRTDLSPQARHIGMVFQDYALFPNMTVLNNIRAGAKREASRIERQRLATEAAERFRLGGLLDRFPDTLSGGEQQRVALARALVSNPQVLLLDEPFAALDSHLRHRLEAELRQTIRTFGKTVLFVSHNRREVFRLADNIAVMHEGHVEVTGTKEDIFLRPGTKTAAVLTGCKNVSPLRNTGNNRILATDWGIELAVSRDTRGMTYAGIHAHDIVPTGRMDTCTNRFTCRILDEIENPFSYSLMLQPEGSTTEQTIAWEADKPTWRALRTEFIEVCLPAERILLLKD